VTIQNKVSAHDARRLLDDLSRGFVARPVAICALVAWYYRGGPWALIGRHAFRGVSRSGRPRRS
jgi:hypothetical protein